MSSRNAISRAPPTASVPSTTSSESTPLPTLSSASTSSVSSTTTFAGSATNVVTAPSTPKAGTIAGSVVGGVVFLAVVVLGILLYLRARKRKRTPPSSEFINSIKDGAAPVLRLDSGAEYTPTLPEKGGYTHHPPVPYHTSPPMLDTKFTDEMTVIDTPSGRPSVEKPLHPQRYSAQQAHDSSQHYPSSSVGSRRELWGSDTDIVSGELSPVRRSPARGDSVLQFAPRFSLDEPSHLSHSPPSLHPLRRLEDT